jgi:hypothetical protein
LNQADLSAFNMLQESSTTSTSPALPTGTGGDEMVNMGNYLKSLAETH